MAKSKAAQQVKDKLEIVEREEDEVQTPTSAVAAFQLPAGLKMKKLVTVPSLAIKTPGEKRIIMFKSATRVSQVVDKKDSKRQPAIIADVTDMETGQPFIFLVPAVVRENLHRDYPEDGYVGKIFYIQNLGKRTSTQRYNDFGVAELEAETE